MLTIRYSLVLLLFFSISSACFTPHSQALSGFGIGFVYGRHIGGLSLRYESLQIFFQGAGRTLQSNNDGDGGFYIDAAARYTHPLPSWNRVKFKVLGQVGRESIIPELGQVNRWRFSTSGSAEVPLNRNSVSKGLFLSGDIGFSVDHTGYVGFPIAWGLGLHVHFDSLRKVSPEFLDRFSPIHLCHNA